MTYFLRTEYTLLFFPRAGSSRMNSTLLVTWYNFKYPLETALQDDIIISALGTYKKIYSYA